MDAPTKTRPTLDDIRAAAERIKGAVDPHADDEKPDAFRHRSTPKSG